ncbi:MAG: hypothetical protein CMN50_05375 [SAR116 cluster bacterium]|nr:hypothetical protein [SAR116 cluster bacterium]
MVVQEYCNCYTIRKISSKISKIYDNALNTVDLKITQYAILKYIIILKKTSLKNLSTAMDYNRSTLGRNIRVLERKKLIRFNKGEDKREVEITITDDGQKIFKIARQSWENINNQISENLGKNKRKMLEEILNDNIL